MKRKARKAKTNTKKEMKTIYICTSFGEFYPLSVFSMHTYFIRLFNVSLASFIYNVLSMP